MGCIALVRCVLVLRCGLAGVVWCGVRMHLYIYIYIYILVYIFLHNTERLVGLKKLKKLGQQ